MCGIILHKKTTEISQLLLKNNQKRGPDFECQVEFQDWILRGFVLSLRNEEQVQPVESSTHILCFNGQDYNTLGSDSKKLSKDLENGNESDLMRVLSQLDGEFAVVIIDKRNSVIYYARDVLGKRSLLIKDDIICSVGDGDGFKEVDCSGVWKIQDEVTTLLSWNFEFKLNMEIPLCCTINDNETSNPSMETNQTVFYSKTKNERLHLKELLARSLTKRSSSIPGSQNPTIAILFSGGLDCMIIAALLHSIVDPLSTIELINVAFQQNAASSYDVPDRKTAINSHKNLLSVCPRNWVLIKVNVPYDESVSCRERILQLIKPSDTVMDLSIAMAFWFAARGIGKVSSIDSTEREYTCNSKVLFSGLGADELLAGYSRHRKAYMRASYPGLLDELNLDLQRISHRNLGRDDRVIGDHSRELRLPFLDTRVVEYLCSLSIDLKCDLNLDKGVGEKALLRGLAWDLGLCDVSTEPKRAVQFGARTAKMGFTKQKGHEKL